MLKGQILNLPHILCALITISIYNILKLAKDMITERGIHSV